MPTIYKVLGQSNPAAQTATSLYTVPAATQTVVSTLNICNLGAANTAFRLAVRPNGASLANSHYIAYDTSIPNNDTISMTIGLTLSANDVVTVYSLANTVTFSLFGSEIT